MRFPSKKRILLIVILILTPAWFLDRHMVDLVNVRMQARDFDFFTRIESENFSWRRADLPAPRGIKQFRAKVETIIWPYRAVTYFDSNQRYSSKGCFDVTEFYYIPPRQLISITRPFASDISRIYTPGASKNMFIVDHQVGHWKRLKTPDQLSEIQRKRGSRLISIEELKLANEWDSKPREGLLNELRCRD